jgi:polysaccharide export outer membrane protein
MPLQNVFLNHRIADRSRWRLIELVKKSGAVRPRRKGKTICKKLRHCMSGDDEPTNVRPFEKQNELCCPTHLRIRALAHREQPRMLSHALHTLARRFSLFVVVASAAAVAGCASPFPPAPRDLSAIDYDYVIGPLDTLNIVVWRNPELSLAVPVRPDGKVTAPLVADVQASGKTASQLSRELEQSLGKFIRDPVVSVIVTTFVGPASEQIRVIGEATKPQVIAYRKNMSVLDVMIQCGGLTDFADGNAASIYRASDGKSYSVRLRDLVKRGDITANVAMRPGDVLIIPQSWF